MTGSSLDPAAENTSGVTTSSPQSEIEPHASLELTQKSPRPRQIAYFAGLVASMGGFMFGYESAEISGKPLPHDIKAYC
jgi:hypothetical protein